MRRWEQRLSGFIRSKAGATVMAAASAFMTWHAVTSGHLSRYADEARTIAFASPSTWIASPLTSMWVNMALLALIALMMYLINRVFTILRTRSIFFAGIFLLMTAATPVVAGALGPSSILAVGILAAMTLLYSVYNRPAATRRVFLAFFIAGTVGLTAYPAFLFVPVLMLGLVQMRVLSLKSILAALIGTFTPLWLAWGFDLTLINLHLRFYFTPPSLLLADKAMLPLVSAAALSLLTGFGLGSLNLLKILSFNARTRALNGLLTLVSIASGVFMIINFENLTLYLTLLNATVAFQAAHFMRINLKRRAYIVALLMIVASVALYIWALSV